MLNKNQHQYRKIRIVLAAFPQHPFLTFMRSSVLKTMKSCNWPITDTNFIKLE